MRISKISKIIQLKEAGSTQDLARRLIENNKAKPKENVLIIAKKQTCGRGQKDNKWSSELGGLYFSFITSIDEKKLKQIQKLSIITAQVILEVMLEKYKVKCYIKLPNDIYTFKNYKKLSGILIETIPNKKKRYIITGIGINFNNKIPKELREKATSIYKITKKKYNPNSFLRPFFEKYFNYTTTIYD